MPKIKQIHDYIHRRDVPETKNTRIGVLVARRVGEEVVLGWSRCNASMGDKFDWKKGVRTAVKNLGTEPPVSFKTREELVRFRCRATRYFRNAIIPTW